MKLYKCEYEILNQKVVFYVKYDKFSAESKLRIVLKKLFPKGVLNIIENEEDFAQNKFSTSELEYKIKKNSEFTYNFLDEGWKLFFLSDLEKLIINSLELTVIHGSAVALNDNLILLVGGSRSGKSTLTYALKKLGCEFVEDECLILSGGQIYGTGLPLKLRKASAELFDDISSSKHLEDQDYYYLPHEKANDTSWTNVWLFFPKYVKDARLRFDCNSKRESFDRLLQNMRYSVNMQSAINDEVRLINNLNGSYTIMYDNCQEACQCIISIIRGLSYSFD